MDHFQGVVTEYLRADRAVFVNTECLINLDADGGYAKNRHWYCDAVAVNFREQTVYLCEVTYSQSMQALLGRLRLWGRHWPEVCEAVRRDCALTGEWAFQPWVFIPKESHAALFGRLALPEGCAMPIPKITHLEDVTPWKYSTWDRRKTAFAELQNTLDKVDLPPEDTAEVLRRVEEA